MKTLKKISSFSLITIAAFSLTACDSSALLGGSPQPEFNLYIEYVEEEVSEDANWTVVEIEIDGYKIDYTWEYGGYHPGEDFDRHDSESKKMSNEEYLELVMLIDEHGLMETVEEDSPFGEGEAVEMSIDLFLDGQSVHSSISGMSDPYPFDDTPSVENTEYLKGVDRVISKIEDILNL